MGDSDALTQQEALKQAADMRAYLQAIAMLPARPEWRSEQQERLYARCWKEIEWLLFPDPDP